MRTLILLIAGLLLVALAAHADDSWSADSVMNRCGYSRESVGVSGSGVVVDFSNNQTQWGSATMAHSVRIKNRDASDALLLQELVRYDSVAVSALTTPVQGTESTVQRIDKSTERSYNGVAWIGVVLQGEDDASADGGAILVDVEWCY